MRILEYNGNLLNSAAQVILHQVNCQGVMGSGVAKAIRTQWPVVYEAYRSYCDTKVDKNSLLGDALMVEMGPGRYVANLFGQGYFGYDGKRYTSYDAVCSGLEEVKNFIVQNNLSSLALPWHMSSDRGGADWNVILALIKSVFNDIDITVEIWKL